MKKNILITVMLLIIFVLIGCNNGTGKNVKIQDLDFGLDRYRIFENQIYNISFDNFGECRFVPIKDFEKNALVFFLIGNDNNIIYKFPEFTPNPPTYMPYDIRHILFTDVNNDTLLDIVIVGNYDRGTSPSGMVQFPLVGMYYQTEDGFITTKEQPYPDSIENDLNKQISNALDLLKLEP